MRDTAPGTRSWYLSCSGKPTHFPGLLWRDDKSLKADRNDASERESRKPPPPQIVSRGLRRWDLRNLRILRIRTSRSLRFLLRFSGGGLGGRPRDLEFLPRLDVPVSGQVVRAAKVLGGHGMGLVKRGDTL